MAETVRRRWGKVGVRLTPEEAKRNDLRKVRRTAVDATLHETWADGRLVPGRITSALNLRKLYGPEVDVACEAQEPDVDQWEAGELYPDWHQVVALARLTDFPLKFFFLPMDCSPPLETSLRFVGVEPTVLVDRFSDEALNAHWERLDSPPAPTERNTQP